MQKAVLILEPWMFCFSQDKEHAWSNLQRALLAEGQSVWCCKSCIGIINSNKEATYQEIHKEVKRLEPLPEVTGVNAGQVGNAAGVPSAGGPSPQTLSSSQVASDQASPQGEAETQAPNLSLGDVSHQRHQQINIDTSNLVGETVRINQQRMVSSDLATQPHMMQEMQRQTSVLIEIKEELAKTRGATVKNCNCDIL